MNTQGDAERPYDALFAELSELLETCGGGHLAGAGFMREIAVLRVKLEELQRFTAGGFGDVADEIGFFREVWPRFYAKLFFYLLAHRFELHRSGLPSGALDKLVRREDVKIARFYRRHREFWVYYRAGSEIIDPLFTREYSRGCVFDPLCWVFAEGATLASWRAAWCLAYEEYAAYLHVLRDPALEPGGDRWEWKETRSAAVDLLKAMAEAGSVHLNGKPATTRQLRTLFEQRFGMEIKDFDNLLYASDTRKIDATPYFTKLKQAFMGRRDRLGK